MLIDHMFAHLCRWGNLATFNCFALEGNRWGTIWRFLPQQWQTMAPGLFLAKESRPAKIT